MLSIPISDTDVAFCEGCGRRCLSPSHPPDEPVIAIVVMAAPPAPGEQVPIKANIGHVRCIAPDGKLTISRSF